MNSQGYLSFFFSSFPPRVQTEMSVLTISLSWWVDFASSSSFQSSPGKFSALHGALSYHSTLLLGPRLNAQPSLAFKTQLLGLLPSPPLGCLRSNTCSPLTFFFLFGLWICPVLSLGSTKMVKWCLSSFTQHFSAFSAGKVFRVSDQIRRSWSRTIWVKVPALLNRAPVSEWLHLLEFQLLPLSRGRGLRASQVIPHTEKVHKKASSHVKTACSACRWGPAWACLQVDVLRPRLLWVPTAKAPSCPFPRNCNPRLCFSET